MTVASIATKIEQCLRSHREKSPKAQGQSREVTWCSKLQVSWHTSKPSLLSCFMLCGSSLGELWNCQAFPILATQKKMELAWQAGCIRYTLFSSRTSNSGCGWLHPCPPAPPAATTSISLRRSPTTKVRKHSVLAGARGSRAACKSQTLIFLERKMQPY